MPEVRFEQILQEGERNRYHKWFHVREVQWDVWCSQSERKKTGRGVKKSTPSITEIDLERIAEYFCYDHMSTPDAKRLQQNILFYIIYFFCRRGRENLYSMKKDTFKYVCEPDGTEYFIQNIDELDKNHGPDDTNPSNEGKMYATGS